MTRLSYNLRVIWAVASKDIRISLTERIFMVLSIITPLNLLLLFLLFVLSGGQAPTAIVLEDNGPYAHQFVEAMQHSNSFIIKETTADEAQTLLTQGQIVAIVTIPTTFDSNLKAGKQITLPVQINNLDVDFTNDIRRAIPLAVTSFYAQVFPNQVVIQAHESDVYQHDTSYIGYLAVSILVVGLMVGGLLQAGTNAAREYEKNTIKELLLSPASRWAIETGKILGSFILNLLAGAVVLITVVFILGIWPDHWLTLLSLSLLEIIIFVSLGTLLGMLVKKRQALIPLSLGLSIPVFFLSGAFGPVNWGNDVIAVLAHLTPVYYAIGIFQYAFHSFDTTALSTTALILILVGFIMLMLALSVFILRRQRVAH
jgi:ABC-type multidrug transport system permease subunit